MKINITNKQYKDLIIALGIANSVLGILGDTTPGKEGKEYKKHSDRMEELEKNVLQYANDFGHKERVDEFEGETVMDDEFYENEIMSIINDYDEYTLYSELSGKLAWRDFTREHTEEEMDTMAKKNHGYFGVALYDYEKKYWDEFEEYDYDRLEIREESESKVIGEV